MLYKIMKSEKLPRGTIKHEVILPGNVAENFLYSSVRIALTWPSGEVGSYMVCGGTELPDELYPSSHGVLRIFEEKEITDLSPEVLFSSVTDVYLMAKADSIFCDFANKDYYLQFFNFLDRHNLRTANVYDCPFKEFGFRLGLIKDWNDSGDLILSKDSPLYSDLLAISRAHLADKPEIKYYRLNSLSLLVGGFSKYPPVRPLLSPKHGTGRPGGGWQF